MSEQKEWKAITDPIFTDEVEGKVVIWAHWQRDVHKIIEAVVKEFGEGCFVDYYVVQHYCCSGSKRTRQRRE